MIRPAAIFLGLATALLYAMHTQAGLDAFMGPTEFIRPYRLAAMLIGLALCASVILLGFTKWRNTLMSAVTGIVAIPILILAWSFAMERLEALARRNQFASEGHHDGIGYFYLEMSGMQNSGPFDVAYFAGLATPFETAGALLSLAACGFVAGITRTGDPAAGGSTK